VERPLCELRALCVIRLVQVGGEAFVVGPRQQRKISRRERRERREWRAPRDPHRPRACLHRRGWTGFRGHVVPTRVAPSVHLRVLRGRICLFNHGRLRGTRRSSRQVHRIRTSTETGFHRKKPDSAGTGPSETPWRQSLGRHICRYELHVGSALRRWNDGRHLKRLPSTRRRIREAPAPNHARCGTVVRPGLDAGSDSAALCGPRRWPPASAPSRRPLRAARGPRPAGRGGSPSPEGAPAVPRPSPRGSRAPPPSPPRAARGAPRAGTRPPVRSRP
jgi:hypothetical protein